MAMFKLIREFRRRHVFRVAIAYAVVGWLLIEVGATVVPALHLPDEIVTVITLLVLLGFPIALVLAWAFELTPDGMRRTEPEHSPDARPENHRRLVGRKLDFVIIGVLLVAVLLLGWQQFVPHPASQPPQQADTKRAAEAVPVIRGKSIAVLPFENLSDDKGNDYFVAGMQSLILSRLSGIGDLKVISRTSTMKYKSRPENVKQVAAELGVSTILEGSVQKIDDEVLITVQLIDARNDSQMWGESYQRTLGDIFGVEGEVAERIAAALHAKLSPAQSAQLAVVPTKDKSAYDLFLRAEYKAERGQTNYDTKSWKDAIELYRQAIAKDPGFALAWARLSYSESALAWFGGGGDSSTALFAKARENAAHALRLMPGSADAHIAIGFSDYWEKGDYSAALESFRKALLLRPSDSNAWAACGFVERRQGRFDAAIASLAMAMTYDPRNSTLAYELGVTNMMANRFDDAITLFEHALALDPNNLLVKVRYSRAILLGSGDMHGALAVLDGEADALKPARVLVLTYQRKYNEAISVLDSIPDTPDLFRIWSGSKALRLAKLHRLAGDASGARALYADALVKQRAQLELQHGIKMVSAWQHVAAAELGLGRKAKALNALSSAQKILDGAWDHTDGPWLMGANASLYAEAGHADIAVPLLAKALATPGIGIDYSPVMLWLDPAWDPIRGDPRFQTLMKKYSKYKPVAAI